MPRHCENGLAVAKFLQSHPKVRFVSYPGLEGDKYYDLAQKYMPNGTCGVVSFGFNGGRAAAETFMKSLSLPRSPRMWPTPALAACIPLTLRIVR